MRKGMKMLWMVAVMVACLCGSAFAQQPGKDWYVALRFGFQPYTTEMSGTVANRDFKAKADLSDILDNTDTTLFGGEVEFGKGRWFTLLSGSYQDTKTENGNTPLGSKVNFTETTMNWLVGYRVLTHPLSEGRALSVDVMGGLYYVNVKNDINLYHPLLGNISGKERVEFFDPMVGARLYYPFTKKFGAAASGQIGGFGVGSELQYVGSASLVYNFTHWFAVSAGYKYWYWKYEDDDSRVSKLEQKVYGPVIGMQFKF
jgi:hypothetical protein